MIWLILCGTFQIATCTWFLTLVIWRPDAAASLQYPYAVIVLLFVIFNQFDVICEWKKRRGKKC